MGGEIGRVTNLDRLLASPGLSKPIFTLIGEGLFLELSDRF